MTARSRIETRVARPADAHIIVHFLNNIDRLAVRNWRWHNFLGQETFLLTRLYGQLVGAFLACQETRSIAWIRVAALMRHIPVTAWLEDCLPRVLPHLRMAGVRRLGWMDLGGWAGPALKRYGFRRQTRLVTLAKKDRRLPPVPRTGVQIRQGSAGDVDALLRIDHAAFTPPWWLSAETLDYMRATSACFIVAERGGECLGYAEAQVLRHYAHIGRLAVAPRSQGSGIGRLLLSETLTRIWNQGAQQVTLNTQQENLTSQRLYLGSGFQPVGDRIDVWERDL